MRHDSLSDPKNFDKVDIAAVMPASARVAPLPAVQGDDAVEQQLDGPERAAPEIPAAVGLMICGIYLALMAALAFATVGSGKSLLAIVVALFFVMMFFSVPAVFLGIDAEGDTRRSLSRFMEQGMETLTGHSTGGAALVQMLVVPVFLTLGVVCIGIIAAFTF